MVAKTQQGQQPDFNGLKATCDDCCNKLRQSGKHQNELKQCEELRNELESAHQMHSSGGTQTVGSGVSSVDWPALLKKAMTVLQAVLAVLVSGGGSQSAPAKPATP